MPAQNGIQLRRQIEAWFMVSTGSPNSRGALRWVARQIGINEKSVKRWFLSDPREKRRLSNQSRASLQLIEQLTVLRFGQRSIDQALRRTGGVDGSHRG